jgi:seryl-tRNA synthetase
MLDINFIRANRDLVQHSITEKMYKNIDLDKLIALDDQRKTTIKEVESLRKERNQNTDSMKGKKPSQEQVAIGKELKEKITVLETKLAKEESEFKNLLKAVPNIIFDDVPLGDESASVEVKQWGGQKQEGVDHLDYAISRDWVDFERGAKVAGAKFYYVKGGLALLENALIQFGIKKVIEHGFTLMDVPDMVNSRVLEGTGFAPRSSEQSDEYYIEGEDLAMIATAEMPITGYHMDEIIDEDKLPLFYAGFSACFRKEAGAYGKHTRGLFRSSECSSFK